MAGDRFALMVELLAGKHTVPFGGQAERVLLEKNQWQMT